MFARTSQSGNTVTDGDVVAGDKITHHYQRKTKLSALFEKLKDVFDKNEQILEIGDSLKRFHEQRDTIGLEQKLINGGKEYLLEDAAWYKQEYFKKLTKFQFFEPAQEVHAFLLGLVLQKFRNIVYPMIRAGEDDGEISRKISLEIIDPIMKTIQEEGCDDIMGLSAVDIEGMIFYLTGQCHIKWTK